MGKTTPGARITQRIFVFGSMILHLEELGCRRICQIAVGCDGGVSNVNIVCARVCFSQFRREERSTKMGQRKKERWLRKIMVDKNNGTDDRKRFTVRDSYTINASFFISEIAVCYRHRKRHRDGVFFFTRPAAQRFSRYRYLHVSKLLGQVVKVLLFYKSFRLSDSRPAALVCRRKRNIFSHLRSA